MLCETWNPILDSASEKLQQICSQITNPLKCLHCFVCLCDYGVFLFFLVFLVVVVECYVKVGLVLNELTISVSETGPKLVTNIFVLISVTFSVDRMKVLVC